MRIRKILSFAIAASMLITSAVIPSARADGGERTPVIKVDFDTAENYTLHGSASLVTGRNGNALSLDGLAAAGAANGAYAKIKDGEAAMKALSGDYSISVWFNPSSTPVWSRVYDLGADTDNYVFLTTSSGALPRYAVKSATEQSVDSDTAFATGVWHNVTVVSSGSTTDFYLDGLKRGTTTAITHKPSNVSGYANMYLGKSQWPDAYYAGLIDDFEVYDCALTEKEVQTLAAEAYDNYKNLMIYQNNCLDTDTHFYLDGEEIFSLNIPEDKPYITDKSIENGKASYTVRNLLKAGDKFGDITAYAAQFDAQKNLVGLKRFAHSEREWTQEVTDIRKIEFDYTEIAGATAKLLVWNGVEPLSETAPVEDNRTLRVVTDITNYTAETSSVASILYSIRDNGAQYKQYTESEILSIEPLETKQLVLETAVKDLRKNDEKLIVELDDFGTGMGTIGQEMATLWYGVESPVAAPADSGTTTDGAHDPSIVKFPGDDTYYVYSSHHLIFTSKDLINWKKYDFKNQKVQTISEKTYNFIKNNINSNVNETYWAPDVIYREGDEHPYWMYISVSCGLGGRNSAISLMKSDSPLFWADKKADIVDAGVVFATKENSSYKTNAIDANIYTDTDGKEYFVWGSFWGGIQSAELTSEGFVKGVNYTSDTTILSSCANFGTTVYSQRSGTAGPEGAWMIDHGNYRYMFTSYGWLGSNYNTRIARSPLSKKFSEDMGTQLVDANNVSMGGQHSSGSTSTPSGYKLIGSYRLGDGSYNLNGNDGDGYSVERVADDAHVYYGPGHNSAITADNGETFYVSHTRKDAPEIAATLQVRKMLWTADGWPVVSPVTYAGEKEQALPKEMLTGTYDFASVGHMKRNGSNIQARNFDLPVLSSKVTLNADGTLADSLGTWTFDGDHTVTLKFTKNGDESKDEFYKNGDTMTMYALYGYDKDEREPVIALTGTDQNHITQFAKKSMASKYKTPAKLPELNIEPISIEKSVGNPELGFNADGNILYAGDPAATVIGDTVYLIAGHDTASNESYVMPEWVLYTSKNMTDWEYKGIVMKATDISWRSNDTSAWASQMTEYKGKYYLYFCTWDKTSGGKQSIGVAVADKPEGPYKDIGHPLVKGDFTTPESDSHDDIDPTVLIDTDENGVEHRYLAWGNTRYYICELNEDMVSIKDIDNDGEIVMHKDVKERKIKSMGNNRFTEAPWLYKRDGKYYLFFASNWREEMAYATCDTPMGRYDYKQTIMPPSSTANTNHPSVIDFNGKTYFIYHNGALPHGSGFRRSVCIQELEFDEDGNVYPLTETSIGLSGKASVIKSKNGKYLAHDNFRNPLNDSAYPINISVSLKAGEDGYNTAWEIVKAKSAPTGQNADNYVSIQSVNKPGLYLKATDSGITLTQDADGKQGEAMTFKTLKGIDGTENTVSFESVSMPGRYITVLGDTLMLSYGTVPQDAVFTIGEATEKDEVSINLAEREPDPTPAADITQNFDAAAGTLISATDASDKTYTALNGVTLYIGNKSGESRSEQNFSIQTGGVSGNALVLNAGKYQSNGRGGRMQLYTPTIPNGYTVTAVFKTKLVNGSGAAKLYYNDSTSSIDDNKGNIYSGTQDTNLTADNNWHTVSISIKNDDDTYMREISVDGKAVQNDYADTFPVFWGTIVNSTGAAVFFDNLSITTTKN